MNLQEKTKLALANLTQGAAFPQSFTAEHEGQQLRCELSALESLACAFTHLALQSDVLANASPQRLKELGELLARRLSYLLEPISPIEVDTEQ